MTKTNAGMLLDMMSIDRESSTPLYLQLDQQIRTAILSGMGKKGTRLPSTRQLASELGISRVTVQGTYDQLVAEGFLTSVTGAGTFIAEIVQETLPSPDALPEPVKIAPGVRLSKRGRLIADTRATTRISASRPFRPGIPAIELFPMRVWSRLWTNAINSKDKVLYSYGPKGGYGPLRKAISDHLGNARGVKCHPEQVIITGGAQQAFALTALALLDPGDLSWGEYPGHTAGRDVLKALGAKVVSIPVDSEGLSIEHGRKKSKKPKLIFVTPSHQQPLGVTMSLRRRLELLKFAEQCNAWILEDDYDSEFRYKGRPLPALKGLDRAERVIYTGSFSKVLYPSLRLGYMVVPTDLIDGFITAQIVLSHATPYLPQKVLAEFINNGNFATHIRKMRVAYAERQSVLLSNLRGKATGLLEVEPSEAGMHLIGWLTDDNNDLQVCQKLWAGGIEAVPLSVYCDTPYHRQGILLGFTGVQPDQIAPNVDKMVKIIGN